ncbi:MAG TPA: EAL domain-containing protein [Pyrinomonadaceae bacterium]|nr:EAL domain-containing protein [Pyrinomonadaceae bacterium]
MSKDTAAQPQQQESGNLLQPYRWAIVVLGTLAFIFTLSRLKYAELGYSYFIFVMITLLFASRMVVKIPGVKGHISVSDTFIFLSILLFGGDAGIVLAVVDAVQNSYKLSKTRMTMFFNLAVFALSTFATVWTLRFFFGSLPDLSRREFTSEYVVAICLMGLTQYVFNSGLVAVAVALRAGKSVWQMWRENFLWTSITYFAGASAAGIITKLIGVFGIYAFLAVVPIVAVVYFTYTTYLKQVESVAKQAELAQKHVEELSHHIAEQERISRALKESEEYFRNAFDHAAGMALISPEGEWLQVNESLCNILGYTEEELLKNGFQAITHPNDLGNDLANLYQLLEGKIPNYQLEKRYCHKTGQTVWVLQSASLTRDADGAPRHVIFQIQDVSDRKKAEELIHHAAFHDALTGLPNRTLFSDRLSMAVERAKRSAAYKFAVVFVDLDRFKIVNDSLGHDMGDKLLIDLSHRLESCLRAIDTVARLGGDEFAILLDGISRMEDATEVAVRIQSSLREPFILDGHEFVSTASMGIAYSLPGYERPEDILRDADTAMYKAKANGKARHEVFDSHMHTRAIQALTLENELRRALEKGEIKPYFQPIVALKTGKIVGFEALARWVHPERGLISPADFIPLAEETGLIVPIGFSILRESCRQIVEWQKSYRQPELSVSVNLSGKQFRQATLIEEIKDILFETELHPHFLKMEITETIVMENTIANIEMLKQLKGIGAQISIDDFGTGYSSLSYLHRFPFDAIKIDRSFVSRMLQDRESLGIVETITALAMKLDKSVIAEGIEKKEHQKLLDEAGCQYGQGYLFSKPVDAATAEQLLRIDSPWQPSAANFAAAGEQPLTVGVYEM